LDLDKKCHRRPEQRICSQKSAKYAQILNNFVGTRMTTNEWLFLMKDLAAVKKYGHESGKNIYKGVIPARDYAELSSFSL
jgi:hypothetical protein